MNDVLLWQIRHFVYTHFANTTHPPSVADTAEHFNISAEEAGEYYNELHNRLSLEYHGRSTEQVADVFKQIGLKSKFWFV